MEFFRSIFGLGPRIDRPEGRQELPPRPPGWEHGHGHGHGQRGNGESPPTGHGDGCGIFHEGPNPNLGFFGVLEEIFREMENAMHDLDDFQGFGHAGGFHSFGNFDAINPHDYGYGGGGSNLPSLPRNDENVRDLVLKEPEKSGRKIDKDLDDMFKKSELKLSELPEPPKDSMGGSVTQYRPPPGVHSTVSRTFFTETFSNGVWERKTVRETNEGKEITTYRKNADGESTETTEFIPYNADANTNQDLSLRSHDNHRFFNPFEIFESMFKVKPPS